MGYNLYPPINSSPQMGNHIPQTAQTFKEFFASSSPSHPRKQTGKKVVSPLSMKRYIASQQPELELETEEDSDNQEK